MNWPFLLLALVCAGFVQGLTGFGFGLICMSMMPVVLGVKQAAAISTVFSLLATLTVFLRHYRQYDWRLGFGFLLSVCVGVPIGVYFLEQASEGFLLKVLGVLMLVIAARELLFNKRATQPIPGAEVPLGVFSGALSGAFNLGGIPTAAYAYAKGWSQGQIMAFLQVVITTSCVLRILCYKKVGYFEEFSWGIGALMAVPLYGAIWAGHASMRRIPPARMRQGVFVFIAAAGGYYLFVH